MNIVGILGLLLAIAFLIFGAYKGLGPLPLSLIASLIAIVTNQMDVWATLSGTYMTGFSGAFIGYYLIFAFSALYAKVMDESGSTTAIALKMIDWFGKKHVLLVSILITVALTYGGVSLFVCVFTMGPVIFTLFKEADVPRKFAPAVLYLGACTLSMTALPGSPQMANIVPTQFLGTSMTAAPVLGLLCSVGLLGLGLIYMEYENKKAIAAGEHFDIPTGFDPARFEIRDRATLPAAWKAFLPIIVLAAIIIIGGRFITNSSMLTVIAMTISAVLCYFLNLGIMRKKSLLGLLTAGIGDSVTPMMGMAAVVGFGSVVSATAAFGDILNAVLSLDMNPYFKGGLSTAVISGITGSSSGGLRIMYENMADYFIASGCDLSILHRLTSIAAGSLDSLPHCPGIFIFCTYFGLTHKTGYKYIMWVSVIIPAVVFLVAAAAVTLLGF